MVWFRHATMPYTYRDEELLDFVHGMCHAQVSLWDGCGHLDEHVQLHGQVGIFGLPTLSQLFLLKTHATVSDPYEYTMCNRYFRGMGWGCGCTLFLSLMEPFPRTEIFAPVSSWSLLIVFP